LAPGAFVLIGLKKDVALEAATLYSNSSNREPDVHISAKYKIMTVTSPNDSSHIEKPRCAPYAVNLP
jgi:hypothetical protein